jgi:hypothetical protein
MRVFGDVKYSFDFRDCGLEKNKLFKASPLPRLHGVSCSC